MNFLIKADKHHCYYRMRDQWKTYRCEHPKCKCPVEKENREYESKVDEYIAGLGYCGHECCPIIIGTVNPIPLKRRYR